MDFSFDTTAVNRLAADLGRAGVRIVRPAAEAVAETAVEVRDTMRDDARGHATFPHFPQAITHDVRGLSAEIGPDKQRRQGALGNLLYFGTARTGPVIEHPAAALGRQAPKIAAAAAEAAAGAVLK